MEEFPAFCSTEFCDSSTLVYVFFLGLLIYRDDVDKLDICSTMHVENIEISNQIKEGLSVKLTELSNTLLNSTKPSTSKRDKSDLRLWREIFSLYENSSIFCSTRECTCLTEELNVVALRNSMFWSSVEAKDYVGSRNF